MTFSVRIEHDQPAPVCPECQESLATVTLNQWLAVATPPQLIDSDRFDWIPGLGQYNVSPGWTDWEEDIVYLEASCPQCAFATRSIAITRNPNGIRFTDDFAMHARL